jgi:hypothetical protein
MKVSRHHRKNIGFGITSTTLDANEGGIEDNLAETAQSKFQNFL